LEPTKEWPMTITETAALATIAAVVLALVIASMA
jgi:hypothetical protein